MIKNSLKSFSKISKIGIVGAGQMGTGIAYVFSRVAGYPVIVQDAFQPSLDKSKSFVGCSVTR